MTTSAAGSGTCVRPMTSSIHDAVWIGENAVRPSASAASSEQSRMPQKRTAGPRCGPCAQSTQRSSGTLTTVWMFALSTGSRTSPPTARWPSGSLIFHAREMVCSPGRTGMMSFAPSLRTGMALPLWVSAVISAAAGNSTRKSSPRLHRRARSSCEVRWRVPSVMVCVPRLTVMVAPAMASGRLSVRSTLSLGHGCQTGIKSPPLARILELEVTGCCAAASKTGGRPDIARFQMGDATRCQRSTQASSARVASFSAGATASPLSHANCCSCAPSRTSIKPSFTKAFEESTFSPGSSGTRKATALPTGESRLTVVRTCQMSPSSRCRSMTAMAWRSCRS